jgi:2'-5' RNA ligase
MPFRWKEKKEEAMVALFHQFARQFDPFKVCLDNFGCFAPRVIFINVAASEALGHFHKSLERFCKRELNLFNANYREEPFHPHLTLAFRDLKKDVFKTAWEEFSPKEFKAAFMADRLTLLRHNGKLWEVFREFRLASSYSADRDHAREATES